MTDTARRLLVIDTATEACSVALFEGNTLVAGQFETLGRGHAERLVPMIAALPDRGKADAILTNRGPGSFTGVRVGLAAARALALAWHARIEGYMTHDLIAAMARADLLAETDRANPIDIVTTGGHGEWFVRHYADTGQPVDTVQSLAPEEAAARCRAEHVFGSQAEALVARRGWGHAHRVLPDARRAGLLDPADRTPATDPVYGRPPDARPLAAAS